MPRARPFSAVRPSADKAALVASRSYVTYSEEELREKLDSNPFSFIHIINPEYQLAPEARARGKDRFLRVKDKYREFLEAGILLKDNLPCYYLYCQDGPTGRFMGWIAAVSCDDYENGNIKVHENTLSARESMFTDYLDLADFNAEPVLLSYSDNLTIKLITESVSLRRPDVDFTTADGIRHQIRVVNDRETTSQIQEAFESIPSFYIADGHHRSASSHALRERRRKLNPNHTGAEPYNDFLAILLPEDDLKILPFHRMVGDLNGFTEEELLRSVNPEFEVQSLPEPKEPMRGQFLFHTKKGNWMLSLRNHSSAPGVIDADLLTNLILAPVLSISDLRTDKQIWFNGGPHGFETMKAEVANGKAAAGFALAPCVFEDVKIIADRGLTMPPKSTWVEPKLRSGLTIYELS